MKNQWKIAIDPGHGGAANGASYGGINEDEMTLAICLQLSAILRLAGHQSLLTRDRDVNISLSQRLAMMRGFDPDCAVSVHLNATVSGEGKASGIEVYFRDEGDEPLAFSVGHHLAMTGLRFRGAYRDVDRLKKHLTVLNDIPIPTILIEVGFLDNEKDRKYIVENHFTIAEVISMGIEAYLRDREKEVVA